MSSIVLLSGPVGAGKTAVAKEIVSNSETPLVYIECDKFWFFIARSMENKSGHKDFRIIMTSMMAAAVPYAAAGYEVLVDFSIPPWFLDTALKVVKVREIPLDYIVLGPAMGVCVSRAALRSEGAIPDYARYEDLYSSFDGFEKYFVKDHATNPVETAMAIRKGLSDGVFRVN